jgi:hypothetical protein
MTVSRRQILQGAGTGVAVLGWGSSLTLLTGCPAGDPNTSYTTHQKETMEAFADAVIPGWYYVGGYLYRSDPDGSSGAVQAGAWNTYWDTYYGLNGWIDECVDDLGSSFKTASLSSRIATINSKLAGNNGPWYASGQYTPIYRGAIMLAKLAFFGALNNTVGTAYVGFPGPSAGYAPEASEPYPY